MVYGKKDRDLRNKLDTYEEQGGIPLPELKNLLDSSDLPEDKLDHFLTRADHNRDKKVNYDEFVRQFLFEDDGIRQRLKLQKRLISRLVLAVAPEKARSYQRDILAKAGYDSVDTYNWGQADVDNYVEAYDCKPPPIFIPLVTLLEIGVFIYYAIMHSRDSNPYNDVTASSGVPIESPLIYNPTKRYEAWRFLTYMLIHNGYLHLAFNCLLQLILGTLLELVHKYWRVGLVYLLGVIAGSLAHSVTDPFVLLAGASGGCYALIGAHLASVIMNWKTMQEQWTQNVVRCLSSGVVRLILIILLVGCDTGMAIYARFTNPDQTSRVGFSAHIGGFAAGILLGIPILRNLQVEKWEKYCFWVSIVISAAFVLMAILFNIFCMQIDKCPQLLW